ncbi:MAG TPA: hypothetical protein PK590_03790, partial [Candidatus Omnitrophota bacterium]|nr:hypothetical protein [Candidatus Omnitrophota bacterium]
AAFGEAKQVLTGGRETWLFSNLSQSTALAMTQNFAGWSLVPHGLLAEGLSLKSPEDWKRRVFELGDAGGKVRMLSSHNQDQNVYVFARADTKSGSTLPNTEPKVVGTLGIINKGLIREIDSATSKPTGKWIYSGDALDSQALPITGFGVFDPLLGANGLTVFSAEFIPGKVDATKATQTSSDGKWKLASTTYDETANTVLTITQFHASVGTNSVAAIQEDSLKPVSITRAENNALTARGFDNLTFPVAGFVTFSDADGTWSFTAQFTPQKDAVPTDKAASLSEHWSYEFYSARGTRIAGADHVDSGDKASDVSANAVLRAGQNIVREMNTNTDATTISASSLGGIANMNIWIADSKTQRYLFFAQYDGSGNLSKHFSTDAVRHFKGQIAPGKTFDIFGGVEGLKNLNSEELAAVKASLPAEALKGNGLGACTAGETGTVVWATSNLSEGLTEADAVAFIRSFQYEVNLPQTNVLRVWDRVYNENDKIPEGFRAGDKVNAWETTLDERGMAGDYLWRGVGSENRGGLLATQPDPKQRNEVYMIPTDRKTWENQKALNVIREKYDEVQGAGAFDKAFKNAKVLQGGYGLFFNGSPDGAMEKFLEGNFTQGKQFRDLMGQLSSFTLVYGETDKPKQYQIQGDTAGLAKGKLEKTLYLINQIQDPATGQVTRTEGKVLVAPSDGVRFGAVPPSALTFSSGFWLYPTWEQYKSAPTSPVESWMVKDFKVEHNGVVRDQSRGTTFDASSMLGAIRSSGFLGSDANFAREIEATVIVGGSAASTQVTEAILSDLLIPRYTTTVLNVAGEGESRVETELLKFLGRANTKMDAPDTKFAFLGLGAYAADSAKGEAKKIYMIQNGKLDTATRAVSRTAWEFTATMGAFEKLKDNEIRAANDTRTAANGSTINFGFFQGIDITGVKKYVNGTEQMAGDIAPTTRELFLEGCRTFGQRELTSFYTNDANVSGGAWLSWQADRKFNAAQNVTQFLIGRGANEGLYAFRGNVGKSPQTAAGKWQEVSSALNPSQISTAARFDGKVGPKTTRGFQNKVVIHADGVLADNDPLRSALMAEFGKFGVSDYVVWTDANFNATWRAQGLMDVNGWFTHDTPLTGMGDYAGQSRVSFDKSALKPMNVDIELQNQKPDQPKLPGQLVVKRDGLVTVWVEGKLYASGHLHKGRSAIFALLTKVDDPAQRFFSVSMNQGETFDAVRELPPSTINQNELPGGVGPNGEQLKGFSFGGDHFIQASAGNPNPPCRIDWFLSADVSAFEAVYKSSPGVFDELAKLFGETTFSLVKNGQRIFSGFLYTESFDIAGNRIFFGRPEGGMGDKVFVSERGGDKTYNLIETHKAATPIGDQREFDSVTQNTLTAFARKSILPNSQDKNVKVRRFGFTNFEMIADEIDNFSLGMYQGLTDAINAKYSDLYDPCKFMILVNEEPLRGGTGPDGIRVFAIVPSANDNYRPNAVMEFVGKDSASDAVMMWRIDYTKQGESSTQINWKRDKISSKRMLDFFKQTERLGTVWKDVDPNGFAIKTTTNNWILALAGYHGITPHTTPETLSDPSFTPILTIGQLNPEKLSDGEYVIRGEENWNFINKIRGNDGFSDLVTMLTGGNVNTPSKSYSVQPFVPREKFHQMTLSLTGGQLAIDIPTEILADRIMLLGAPGGDGPFADVLSETYELRIDLLKKVNLLGDKVTMSLSSGGSWQTQIPLKEGINSGCAVFFNPRASFLLEHYAEWVSKNPNHSFDQYLAALKNSMSSELDTAKARLSEYWFVWNPTEKLQKAREDKDRTILIPAYETLSNWYELALSTGYDPVGPNKFRNVKKLTGKMVDWFFNSETGLLSDASGTISNGRIFINYSSLANATNATYREALMDGRDGGLGLRKLLNVLDGKAPTGSLILNLIDPENLDSAKSGRVADLFVHTMKLLGNGSETNMPFYDIFREARQLTISASLGTLGSASASLDLPGNKYDRLKNAENFKTSFQTGVKNFGGLPLDVLTPDSTIHITQFAGGGDPKFSVILSADDLSQRSLSSQQVGAVLEQYTKAGGNTGGRIEISMGEGTTKFWSLGTLNRTWAGLSSGVNWCAARVVGFFSDKWGGYWEAGRKEIAAEWERSRYDNYGRGDGLDFVYYYSQTANGFELVGGVHRPVATEDQYQAFTVIQTGGVYRVVEAENSGAPRLLSEKYVEVRGWGYDPNGKLTVSGHYNRGFFARCAGNTFIHSEFQTDAQNYSNAIMVFNQQDMAVASKLRSVAHVATSIKYAIQSVVANAWSWWGEQHVAVEIMGKGLIVGGAVAAAIFGGWLVFLKAGAVALAGHGLMALGIKATGWGLIYVGFSMAQGIYTAGKYQEATYQGMSWQMAAQAAGGTDMVTKVLALGQEMALNLAMLN